LLVRLSFSALFKGLFVLAIIRFRCVEKWPNPSNMGGDPNRASQPPSVMAPGATVAAGLYCGGGGACLSYGSLLTWFYI
jgi:hypothetical protein